MLETIERMAAVTTLKLSAQPNAGPAARRRGPQHLSLLAGIHGVVRAALHPAQRADGRRLLRHDAGAHPADQGGGPKPGAPGGGAGARRPSQPHQSRAGGRAPGREDREGRRSPREEKSRLAHSLAHGRFVVAVEVVAPRGVEYDEAIARARALKARGVDAISIPDGHRTSARISGLSLAVLIEQQAGIETLLHYACRDRNLLGIQSDLLGAHAMGLRNLMLVTGDPGRVGDYPDATAVFDVDSIGLTNLVSRLNHGCDLGGQPIGAPARFHIGVSVNPAAPNLDDELRRFEYKVEAGAEFVVTRPVFDVGAFERFLKRIESAGLPVVAGLLPFERAPRGVHRQRSARDVGAGGAARPHAPGAPRRGGRRRRGDRARPRAWAAHGCARAADFDHIRANRGRPGRSLIDGPPFADWGPT